MNTAPKLKRHSVEWAPIEEFRRFEGRTLRAGLSQPDLAVCLATIVTEFEHLEDHMTKLLAVLAGADRGVAPYIMRSIKSPRGRTDLLRDLLELAPRNKDRGEEYDQALREFAQTGKLRNTYVHGRWWTVDDDSEATFCETDDHADWELFKQRPVERAELDYVIYRIRRTAALVSRLTLMTPENAARLPPIPPLLAAPKNASNARRRIEAGSPPPSPPAPDASLKRAPRGPKKSSPSSRKGARKKS